MGFFPLMFLHLIHSLFPQCCFFFHICTGSLLLDALLHYQCTCLRIGHLRAFISFGEIMISEFQVFFSGFSDSPEWSVNTQVPEFGEPSWKRLLHISHSVLMFHLMCLFSVKWRFQQCCVECSVVGHCLDLLLPSPEEKPSKCC